MEGTFRGGGENVYLLVTEQELWAGTEEGFEQMRRNGRKVRFQDVQSSVAIREYTVRGWLSDRD